MAQPPPRFLIALSAGSSSSAHHGATDALARFIDVGAKPKKKSGAQYITVVDESNNVFKDYDIKRLTGFSSVCWFPAEQEDLTRMIVA